MPVDDLGWPHVLTVCLLLAAVVVAIFWRGPGAFIFGVPIEDGFNDRLRSAVIDKASALKLKGMEPRQAQNLITETARHAIGEFFATEHPGKTYRIKPNGWPHVHTIIVDHLAVIEIDLGLEWRGRYRIEPVKVRAQLEDEAWDARPAIRAVLRRGEIPNGLPEGGLKSPRAEVAGTTTQRAGVITSEQSVKRNAPKPTDKPRPQGINRKP